MSVRLVMPRELPFAESNAVQQRAWRAGYSTRGGLRDPARRGSVLVEFLRVLPELPAPEDVAGLEADLDRLLDRLEVPQGQRRRAWLEDVPERRISSRV